MMHCRPISDPRSASDEDCPMLVPTIQPETGQAPQDAHLYKRGADKVMEGPRLVEGQPLASLRLWATRARRRIGSSGVQGRAGALPRRTCAGGDKPVVTAHAQRAWSPCGCHVL